LAEIFSSEIKRLIPILAQTTASVLLSGEKGTGKSWIASSIHQCSGNSQKNFFEINCKASGDEKSLEVLAKIKELLIQNDNNVRCTLFVNCINLMKGGLQARLLDFLKEVLRTQKNVKLISSTEENLEEKIAAKTFAEELFYKINSVVLNVPPLRQRKDEISVLAEYYRKLYCSQTGYNFTGFGDGALSVLENYFFPGNIDELKNLIQHAFIVGELPVIKADDFGVQISSHFSESTAKDLNLPDKSLKTALDAFKKEYVTKILEENGWNQTKTAKILGIQRTYVIRLINELHIQKK
jgi:Nif-specific regulatory protein